LGRLLDQLGGRMRVILVLNEVRGDRFDILEASGLLARAEEMGVKVMRLRHLQDAAMRKIDARNSSFWAAVNVTDKDAASLGLMERQRVKLWLNKAYGGLEALAV